MAIYQRGNGLSRMFSTAVFFAADDEEKVIAIAYDGISEVGSSVNHSSVVPHTP